MSIELVKIPGEKLRRAIFRCIRLCHRKQDLPDDFRIERMILLYKQKEKLDDLDNYRRLFLRLIIVTIYEKWLFSKCVLIADKNGNGAAFGGRKGKDTLEPLLIIKLVQDHARWTKKQFIFKFIDVE